MGYITLTCRTHFWANSIKWLDDTYYELTPVHRHTLVDTIPGWEKTTTFEFKGRGVSDGDYTCEASDTSRGRTERRTITIVAVGRVHRTEFIDYFSPRGSKFDLLCIGF